MRRISEAVVEGAGGGVPGTQHGAAPRASEALAQLRFTRRRCSRDAPTGTLTASALRTPSFQAFTPEPLRQGHFRFRGAFLFRAWGLQGGREALEAGLG